MNRRKLLEVLAVERHSPSPRPPEERFKHPWPQMPDVTPEQAEENRRVLLDALSDDPVVVEFRERFAS